MSTADGSEPLGRIHALAQALRATGVPVGTGRLVGLARAAAAVEPDDLYWAARATLISRREDIAAFDRAFAAVFGVPDRPQPLPQPVADRRQVIIPNDLGAAAPLDGSSDTSLSSPIETLRRKDFAGCSEDELAQIARMMARLRVRAPVRRTRRRRPARTGDPDLRRTLRRAMRTGGEPIERAWRRRRVQRRRLLLILDVSGSMSTYSRALALFAHASLRAGPGDWEAFAFGTRLTRMTRALSVADADVAISAAAAEVSDWDGGTRIGASLKRLIDEHGRTRAVRGATCVILSDGLDVGDPELLGEQMARLSRLAHRVVWLNPLKGHDAYEPLARGMAAALPHVDVFRPGHNLQSLEEVADVIARL
ncbi:MAG TPA: VWA domain-containing protein [Miltoncostaeaceae bacterium]|nr:VWA domain-containing protein [Miltoncostaeaceae bacterium]